MLVMIQFPASISTRKILKSFGTKVSVCYCIDVTVWRMLMIRPTISDTSSIGAETLIIR